MRAYGLKDYEALTALKFFCYYMSMEQRSQLIAEFPVIYNKLVGSEIVVSISKSRLDSLNFLATTLPDHKDLEKARAEGCA